MLTFWLIASGIIAVVLGLILSPLLKRSDGEQGPAQRQVNAEIFRLKLSELEAEREAGTLGSTQFEQARIELERTALTDLSGSTGAGLRASTRRAWSSAIVIAVLLPALAVPLYLRYGRSDLVSPPSAAKLQAEVAKVSKLPHHDAQYRKIVDYVVDRLVRHLRDHPQDAKAWKMLGQAYMGLNRFHDAAVAYGRLNHAKPNQPAILVDYAEALALDQGEGGNFKGAPQQLLDRALQLDPNYQKGLWFAGIAQYNDRNYDKAVHYWQHLLSLLPAKSNYIPVVQANIRKAQHEAAAVKAVQEQTPAAGGAKLKVRVSLAHKLVGRVGPQTTVFVFARAAKGPAMPLAVVRLKVKDLPTTVTLSDSMAMSPVARLSNFHSVMLAARVSPSGQPLPKSGDLQGSTGPVKVGGTGTANLTIDQVVP